MFTCKDDVDEFAIVAGLIYNLNVSELFWSPLEFLASCFEAANFVSNELKIKYWKLF